MGNGQHRQVALAMDEEKLTAMAKEVARLAKLVWEHEEQLRAIKVMLEERDQH